LVDLHNEFAMLGFDANGWLDNTFSDGGFVATYLGDSATAYAIAVSDDEILLAGHALVGFDALLAVARYTANGSLDTTFGNANGYEFTEVGDSPYAYGLAIQPSDGKIVVAGGQGAGDGYLIVLRGPLSALRPAPQGAVPWISLRQRKNQGRPKTLI